MTSKSYRIVLRIGVSVPSGPLVGPRPSSSSLRDDPYTKKPTTYPPLFFFFFFGSSYTQPRRRQFGRAHRLGGRVHPRKSGVCDPFGSTQVVDWDFNLSVEDVPCGSGHDPTGVLVHRPTEDHPPGLTSFLGPPQNLTEIGPERVRVDDGDSVSFDPGRTLLSG